jgi:hypothetical protein
MLKKRAGVPLALAGLMCGVLSFAAPSQADVEDYIGDYSGNFSGDGRGDLEFFVGDFGDAEGTLTIIVGKRDSIRNGEENDLSYPLFGSVSDKGVLTLFAEYENEDFDSEEATFYCRLKVNNARSGVIGTRGARWYTTERTRGTWSAKTVQDND